MWRSKMMMRNLKYQKIKIVKIKLDPKIIKTLKAIFCNLEKKRKRHSKEI